MPEKQERPIKTTRLNNAAIQWDGNGLPRSAVFGDIYFSAGDPLAESRYVFLGGNALGERLANMPAAPGPAFVIGECGFGSGLNFLLAAELFCRVAPAQSRLHYLACELQPLRKADLQRIHALLPMALRPYSGSLLELIPEQERGLHRLAFTWHGRAVTLDLLFDDAIPAWRSLSNPGPFVDAWFLDGFAPAANPDMWSLPLCRTLAALSKAGATLATYSAAGSVRRNLEASGFQVEKRPGFGSKRHMLAGRLARGETSLPANRPGWSDPWPERLRHTGRVCVIGAGLAGSATAHALAVRGHGVTLLERHQDIATGASGNPRGIVHLNPSRQLTPASLFRLSAFRFAVRHYHALAQARDFSWTHEGVIQPAVTERELSCQRDLDGRELYDPALLQFLPAGPLGKLAGLPLETGGLFYPSAGCLDPAALCRAWLMHDNISLETGCLVQGLAAKRRNWTVTYQQGNRERRETFDSVVICTGAEQPFARGLPEWPLVFNHGQTDTFFMDGFPAPSRVVSHQAYLMPWQGEEAMLTIGGSFVQGRLAAQANESLRKKNLALVAKLSAPLAAWLTAQGNKARSHAATRCTTPDYLPLAGPVEDAEACGHLFGGYRRNARRHIDVRAHYLPGLYVNLAHGSSGLTTTPLLAEYIASLIDGDSLPLTAELTAVIHPLRFRIRAMKKQAGS